MANLDIYEVLKFLSDLYYVNQIYTCEDCLTPQKLSPMLYSKNGIICEKCGTNNVIHAGQLGKDVKFSYKWLINEVEKNHKKVLKELNNDQH